jgi:hypothetical protein
VVGARATFRLRPRPARATALAFGITAEEAASVEARIVRASTGEAVAFATGKVAARWTATIRFPRQRLTPGWYVYSVTARAELNPARASSLVSSPFRVF